MAKLIFVKQPASNPFFKTFVTNLAKPQLVLDLYLVYQAYRLASSASNQAALSCPRLSAQHHASRAPPPDQPQTEQRPTSLSYKSLEPSSL